MNIFEFVKSKVSILDVVNEYVTLKPAGRYWKGPSPFKHERVPSFTISPHKEIYYCFSSAQGGDVISFISAIEHCTPLEAVQHLIDRYKIQVPETIEWKKVSSEDISKRDRYEKVCSFFAHWCQQQLKKSLPAQKYLHQRSLMPTAWDQFQIGYCPAGMSALHDLVTQAQKQSLLMQDFLDAHILMEGRQGLYSPYEERIIFPIHNHIGDCCGFGGRIFRDTDDRAKYYNSHEHAQFNKSGLLFGLHKAKKKIQQTGTTFLVEGYLDCIAMAQIGYTNTLATLGTACTIDHLKQIARHAQKVYVIYDGDEAGQKAILRLAQLCWHVHLELFIVILPSADDPASFLAKGNSLDPLIAAAENIFLFSIKQLGNQFFAKSLQEKLGHINQLLELITQLSDPLQKDLLLHTMANTFDMSFETLKNHLRQKKTPYRPTKQEPATLPLPTDQKAQEQGEELETIDPLEKKLFSAILHHEAVLTVEDYQFLQKHLSKPLANMLATYYAGYPEQKNVRFDVFFQALSQQEQSFVSHVIIETGILHNNSDDNKQSAAQITQLMQEFYKKQWKKQAHELKQKIAQQQTLTCKNAPQELNQLLIEFQELKKKMIHKTNSSDGE